MIKIQQYRKRVEALKFIRENDVKQKDIKNLYGEEGKIAFEEAVKFGAIYPTTMGILGKKIDKIDTLIEKYKGLIHDKICKILKIVIGFVLTGAISYSITIVINFNSQSNNINIVKH